MEWEKRRFFVYMVASAHHVITKEVENRVFQDKCIFRHTRIYKEHKLTRHWNYNNSVQILYSYLRYTDRLCGCVFLVARYNIISASWELRKNERLNCRKKYTEKFVWGTSFFWLHILLLMSFFVAFFISSFSFFCSEFAWKKHFCSKGPESAPLVSTAFATW